MKIVCDRPLVPNADGTKCVCRDGLVLRRGKCVEAEQPKREKHPKRETKCPRGTVRIDGECVQQRRDEPRHQIERLPGLGGRGLGGGRHTGGATPKRERALARNSPSPDVIVRG